MTSAGIGAEPCRILVVDDAPASVRVLEAMLSAQGYEVVTASGGRAALEQVVATSPDLVLLDIQMPDLDGYEVCRHLRQQPSSALLPVVMLTAAGTEERLTAIEAGAD